MTRAFTPRPAQPYAEGNEAAVTHGAWSARAVQPIADGIVAHVAEIAPWAAMPTFLATVQAWAWSEAQLVLLRRYIDTTGMLDADGQPIPACALLERVEARAARLRSELGLTPAAWAKLVARLGNADGEAVAAGIAALRDVGRELDRSMRGSLSAGGQRD